MLKQRRDVAVVMVAAGGQQKRVAQPARERLHHLRDGALELAPKQRGIRGGIARRVLEIRHALIGIRRRVALQPRPDRSPVIERLAPDDAQEPGAKGGGIVQRVQTSATPQPTRPARLRRRPRADRPPPGPTGARPAGAARAAGQRRCDRRREPARSGSSRRGRRPRPWSGCPPASERSTRQGSRWKDYGSGRMVGLKNRGPRCQVPGARCQGLSRGSSEDFLERRRMPGEPANQRPANCEERIAKSE